MLSSDRLEVITTDPFGNRLPGGYLVPGEQQKQRTAQLTKTIRELVTKYAKSP